MRGAVAVTSSPSCVSSAVISVLSAATRTAMVRLRHCPDTQAYIQRRLTEGLWKREAIRCAKRYVARQTYHAIRADLATTAIDDL